MRRVLWFKIAVRVALFIFIDYYIFSPFPQWLIDFEFTQSLAFADFFHEFMRPDYGSMPYPDLQDDIFCLMLFFTGLIPTIAIMMILEKIFTIWRSAR